MMGGWEVVRVRGGWGGEGEGLWGWGSWMGTEGVWEGRVVWRGEWDGTEGVVDREVFELERSLMEKLAWHCFC